MIHVNLICRVCGIKYNDSYEFSEHYYGTVCPECRAIDPRTRSEEDRLGELRVLIEKVWREYQNLQDQYRKLTGKEHGWL
jgi:hypothetical protein